jgi:hypothetical protein
MANAVIQAIGPAHFVEQLPLRAIVQGHTVEQVLKPSPTRADCHVCLP